MSIDSEFEEQEDEICQRFNDGEISLSEYNKELNELYREYRSMAQEACQEAYDDEAQNWY